MKFPSRCRFTVAVLAFAAFTSCGPGRYPTNYVLNFPPIAPSVAPAPETRGSLAVYEFDCPQYLCEGRIVYRPTAEEIGFYEFHRWAMNPSRMITQFVTDAIRSRALFKTVTLQQPDGQPAYVLKGAIERLEEVDQGRQVRAVCTISAQLFDTQTKSMIWSDTATQNIAVQKRDVAGVVSSLSTAVRATADSLVRSLQKSLPALASN
jgi:ABC-type uncharacterized transport system auxiliary subunit